MFIMQVQIHIQRWGDCIRDWRDDANSVIVSDASWFEGHEESLDNKE